MSKTQVGGDHYTKLGITPFEYSMVNGLDAMQHTSIKYITRFRDKNGIVDLEKARDTINQLIEYEYSKLEPKIDWIQECRSLSMQIVKHLSGQIDTIVIVPRGGLTLGHMIAEYLGVKDVELFNPDTDYTQTCVLLVDDINDSGKTLIDILTLPGTFDQVRTVVLAQRYSSNVTADYIGVLVNHDGYITFPWEVEK